MTGSDDAPLSFSKRALLRTAALIGLASGGLVGNAAVRYGTAAKESSAMCETASMSTTLDLLRGQAPASTRFVQTLGFRQVGDGGGATFLRLAVSEHTDDFESLDGSRWRLILEGGVANVRQFGAIGDSESDDTLAIRKAVSTLRWQAGSVLYFPPGHYVVSRPVLNHDRRKHRDGLRVHGDGPAVSVLKPRGPIDGFLFSVTGDTSRYGAPHARFVDFSDFGVEGNGSDIQNVFSITCADRINFHNVHAFNCRGHGIYAREWWDSLCDVRLVRCGDDTEQSEKAVIDLDYVFEDSIGDSACNNIVFPATVQIEAYLQRAMRWGFNTRKNRFAGKIHPDLNRNYSDAAVLLDGARENTFEPGYAVGHANANGSHIYSIELRGRDGSKGWSGPSNAFLYGHGGGGIQVLGSDLRGTQIVGNYFLNHDKPGVLLNGGPGVLVRDNMCSGSGPEVYFESYWSIHTTHIPKLHIGKEPPQAGWGPEALHVYDPARASVAVFESGRTGSSVSIKNAVPGRAHLLLTPGEMAPESR